MASGGVNMPWFLEPVLRVSGVPVNPKIRVGLVLLITPESLYLYFLSVISDPSKVSLSNGLKSNI